MKDFLSGFERIRKAAERAGIVKVGDNDETVAIKVCQALELSPAEAGDGGSSDTESEA